jgi:hypothetical protein
MQQKFSLKNNLASIAFWIGYPLKMQFLKSELLNLKVKRKQNYRMHQVDIWQSNRNETVYFPGKFEMPAANHCDVGNSINALSLPVFATTHVPGGSSLDKQAGNIAYPIGDELRQRHGLTPWHTGHNPITAKWDDWENRL